MCCKMSLSTRKLQEHVMALFKCPVLSERLLAENNFIKFLFFSFSFSAFGVTEVIVFVSICGSREKIIQFSFRSFFATEKSVRNRPKC